MIGLPWFSRDLNQLVHPVIAGRVYGVIAPTGTGKTLVDINLVAHWLDETDAQVCVAATEETSRYIDLLACRAAAVSYGDLFYDRLSQEAKQAVARARDFFATHPRLSLLPIREPTLTAISKAVKQGPDVLIVDHLHGLDRSGCPLPIHLDLAMGTLTELADQGGIAVVFLAQVHRPHIRDPLYAYRIPTAHSGLGSPKIEQSADVLLGASRKLKDNIPKSDLVRLAKGLLRQGESIRDFEEPNTARISVLKHRMDDEAARRSVLLSVNHGKMQDRITLVEDASDDSMQGGSGESNVPF